MSRGRHPSQAKNGHKAPDACLLINTACFRPVYRSEAGYSSTIEDCKVPLEVIDIRSFLSVFAIVGELVQVQWVAWKLARQADGARLTASQRCTFAGGVQARASALLTSGGSSSRPAGHLAFGRGTMPPLAEAQTARGMPAGLQATPLRQDPPAGWRLERTRGRASKTRSRQLACPRPRPQA